MDMDKKLVNLALFVDFKKAFDLINPKLLFHKLFHYGFDNNSLNLFRNFFVDRVQVCKVNDSISSPADIEIGLGKGFVTAPLLFLIYINDLSLNVDLKCFLFADDTSLFDSGDSMDEAIVKFKSKLNPFLEWTKFNQLTINWTKTKFMVISRNKLDKPKFIKISNEEIEIVEMFKLLGVKIDSCLTFKDHVKHIKAMVNQKLYALRKLSFLATSVKLQFFKSFILPHFDYCSGLAVFYNKKQINSIEKFFNVCLFMQFLLFLSL